MEILETAHFLKLANDYLNSEELDELRLFLAISPDAGVVIRFSGGCRKLRWRGKGRGKRGGYRIIYFYRGESEQIWLLTMYAKSESEMENISTGMLKKWRQEIES